jgi:invasion protein IalB
MIFEVLLPLQIDLAFGLKMSSKNIDPKTYRFVTCVSQGCLVSFELDEPLIESMKKNREFSLRFGLLNADDAILAKVNIKGFSRAIAKLNLIKSGAGSRA